MKKLILLTVFILSFILSAKAIADTPPPLGRANIALKVDGIGFLTDDPLAPNYDNGVYIALEGYVSLTPNWYVGGEIGYADVDGFVTVYGTNYATEALYIPIEVNLKHVTELAANISLVTGAGVAVIHLEESADSAGGHISITDALYGGQVFIGLNYAFGRFFVGADGKYQMTSGFNGYYDYSNWRAGGHLGLTF